MPVRSSDCLWQPGGGYYTESADQLREKPFLPDIERLRDRRLARLFEEFAALSAKSRVLEIGCGRSPWLPYLAQTFSCDVGGIDVEPSAAELARANLEGAGVSGTIVCGDAFSPEANRDFLASFDLVYSIGVLEHFDDVTERLTRLGEYLRAGGRILTTVPNLQGINWLLQRMADRERLEMHVVYRPDQLARVHEEAGFSTISAGYAGFCDGYLTAPGPASAPVRTRVHRSLCRMLGILSEAWIRTFRETATPEMAWLSPHVFYVGRSQ